MKDNTLDYKYKIKIRELLRLFRPQKKEVDFEAYAKLWIEVLQPYLEEKRNRYKTSLYVYNLKNLTKREGINRIKIPYEKLLKIIDELPVYENIGHKIAACIVGVTNYS